MKRAKLLWYGIPLLVLFAFFVHLATASNAQEGNGAPPEILAVDFPKIIPPDGTAISGEVEFFDPDHDVVSLELSVVRAYDFSAAQFVVNLGVQTPGKTMISLSSKQIQPIALAARMIDAQGNRSEPFVFHFAAVTPDREVAPGVFFINAWGEKGKGPGQFDFEGPQGIRPGPDGNIYVIDEGASRIQVFTPQGEYLREWGRFGTEGPGRFNFPSDLVFSPDGNIYVSDSINHRIQVFDLELNFLFEWGSKGFKDGQFINPRGLAFNSKNELFVVDERNGRIQVFDRGGNFLRKWGKPGNKGAPGTFNVIVGVDVDVNDEVYVADGFHHRIQVFDEQGNFLRQFGEFGKKDGQFDDPVGVAVAPEGWLAVTDSFSSRLHIWTTEGKFMFVWGSQSDAPGSGFKLPLGAATDGLGMLYIGDHFNRRAQSFYVAITAGQIAAANAATEE